MPSTVRRLCLVALVIVAMTHVGCRRVRRVIGAVRAIGATSALTSAAPRARAKPASMRPTAPLDVAEPIYVGKLAPGWQDWGWGAHDLSSGPAKIRLSQYGGWILYNDHLGSKYGELVFKMYAPPQFGSFLQVRLAYQHDDSSLPAVDVNDEVAFELPDGWIEVHIPWLSLNPTSSPVDHMMLHAMRPVGDDWVQIDQLVLTKFDPAKAAANAPARDVQLSVDCRAPSHAISPYIYGVAGDGDIWDLGATVRRWGGNPTTRYNWQLRLQNVGKDWYFENAKGGDYLKYIDDNHEHGMGTALTVPMIGWVAKDAVSSGFPVSVFGPQHSVDQWRAGAGDGLRADGSPIPPGPPTQTSLPAPPSMMEQWVRAIQNAPDGKQRKVDLYFLDNEPALWNSTHRDVHPDPVTYDELLDRTVRYGTAIRSADPHAVIAGPSEWGWTAFFYSAKDAAAGAWSRPDRRAHGDKPLLEWYLEEMHKHDTTSGVRVLDVLDVHWYPQGNLVFSGASDAATAALRVRSTRSLWDPTYEDESWIKDKVRLIPRLKEWIAESYPGLPISIGEYSFGGEQHMSGALALAETLGRFGVEGVTYAFYWVFPPKNSPTFWAFRAFRNFDGKGGHFLDQSMPVRMATDVSLFASRDASSHRIVAIALNLDPASAAHAKIDLGGCPPIASRRMFSYSAGSDSIGAVGPPTSEPLDVVLPPYSINVFDVALQ